ncbi:MAG TPA: mechanosensitive ion channel family protein [Burkholderiales bacterium]|jgi:small conductance mechanosensitive channel
MDVVQIDQVTTTAIDLGMRFGPKLLVAILILVGGLFAGRWASRSTLAALRRFRLEPPVEALIARFVWVIVFGLFAIMALQNLGVELLPLIAGLSVIGAGVALAAQGVLGNVIAGLTIIFTRPFRVGDYVSIVKEEGEVLEIKLFSTTLGHADRSKVVIPNRKIVGEILHNYGHIRQLALEVAVAGDADVKEALAAVDAVLRANRRVLQDPAPVVGVASLDGRVTIAIRPWTALADYGPAGAEVNQAVLEAFRARRIAMPVPQREVRLLRVHADGASAEAALRASA